MNPYRFCNQFAGPQSGDTESLVQAILLLGAALPIESNGNHVDAVLNDLAARGASSQAIANVNSVIRGVA